MDLNQPEIEELDRQTESDRDRQYLNRTVLQFDFDEQDCNNSFEAHLPLLVRLCQRLLGTAAASGINHERRAASPNSTWALLDDQHRGILFHHDRQVQGTVQDEGEYVDVFWSTVGLPHAFAACYQFGRCFLDGSYDVSLNPIVSIESNISQSEHEAAVNEFIHAMAELGYPRQS